MTFFWTNEKAYTIKFEYSQNSWFWTVFASELCSIGKKSGGLKQKKKKSMLNKKPSKRGILLQLETWAVNQGYTMWCSHFLKVELFKACIPCLSCWHSNWLSAFHNGSSWLAFHFICQTHCWVFLRCTRVRDKADRKCITYCSHFAKVHPNTNKVRQEIIRIGLLSSTAISSIAQFSDKPKFLALSH